MRNRTLSGSMKRTIIQCVCLAVAALLMAPQAGAEVVPAEVDAVFRRYIALPDQIVPVLAKVQDYDTAEQAAAELQNLLPAVYDSRQDLSEISGLSPAVAAELRRRYEKDMRTRWGRAFEHIFRIQQAQCYKSPAFTKQFTVLCMLLEK